VCGKTTKRAGQRGRRAKHCISQPHKTHHKQLSLFLASPSSRAQAAKVVNLQAAQESVVVLLVVVVPLCGWFVVSSLSSSLIITG